MKKFALLLFDYYRFDFFFGGLFLFISLHSFVISSFWRFLLIYEFTILLFLVVINDGLKPTVVSKCFFSVFFNAGGNERLIAFLACYCYFFELFYIHTLRFYENIFISFDLIWKEILLCQMRISQQGPL